MLDVNSNILEMFSGSKFIDESSNLILHTKISKFLFEELGDMVEHARKVKDHPLSFLKFHSNAGKNTFQTTANKHYLEESFIYPYIINLGEYYLKLKHPNKQYNVSLMNNFPRGIHYHFIINFGYKGDMNPKHSHSGLLSGVIYYCNDLKTATKFYIDNSKPIEFIGKPGDLLIFPSSLPHGVEELESDGERITFAFNLN